MEFGKLPLPQIKDVDFGLPAEPPGNQTILPGPPAAGKIYVGMTQWGRTEWVDQLYPSGTPEKQFLGHYVKHFNTVELNATHYSIYGPHQIAKWAERAKGLDFKFCPKLNKGITHRYPLAGNQALLQGFLQGVEAFGEHLGPIFIQLHDQFNNKKDLHAFFESLPDRFRFFLELRHPDLLRNEKLFDYLRSKKIGAVITDTAGRRDAVHMQVTVPSTLIRFVANDHPSDVQRVHDWALRIQQWLDNGMQEIYFFVHYADDIKSLHIAKDIIDHFNSVCGTSIPPLQLG